MKKGIKPCVGAFGANQFKPTQQRYIENFFSIFYISINLGSLISTILTPIFRSDVKCFEKDCFPLAFGVPAIFMLFSIVLFVIGTPFYDRTNDKPKNKSVWDNIILQTVGCIFRGIVNKIKHYKTSPREHWLDYADDKYSAQVVSDVKSFCRVGLVFIPLPIFWTLYEQQGSRWTEQAQQLSGIIGTATIKPDQFQAVNAILIVLFVPLFDFVIYPVFAKINIFKKLLQRMAAGLFMVIVSFAIAAILESQMQNASASLNLANQIKVINLSPCRLEVEYTDQTPIDLPLSKYMNNEAIKLPKEWLSEMFKETGSAKLSFKPLNCDKFGEINVSVNNLTLPKTLILYQNKNTKQLDMHEYGYDQNDQPIGESKIKFASFNLNNQIESSEVLIKTSAISYGDFSVIDIANSPVNEYKEVDYAEYTLTINSTNYSPLKSNFLIETCGKYTVLLFEDPLNNVKIDYVLLTDLYPNGLSLFLQLIQITVLTCGEVMFSISGI